MNIQDVVIKYQMTDDERQKDILFNEIYNYYLPKLKYHIRKYNNEEDRISEYGIALTKALDKYENNEFVKFNSFYWTYIKNMDKCINKHENAQKRKINKLCISYFTEYENGIKLYEVIEDNKSINEIKQIEDNILLHQIKEYLTDKELDILLMRNQGYTLEKIANKYNVTPVAIHVKIKRIKNRPIFKTFLNI